MSILDAPLVERARVAVTVGATKSDYKTTGTNDDVVIQQAIDYVASQGGGTVYIKAGTYSTLGRIIPASNVTIQGAGRNSTILFGGNDFDYTFFSSTTTNNAVIRDLTVDSNNNTNASGARLYYWQDGIIERVTFKNVPSGGWHLKFGVGNSATDNTLCLNNRLIDCEFDGHAGSLESVLLFNAKNTDIIRPRFRNKTTTGPVLGLWQKTYGTRIINPTFDDIVGFCIYYSVTTEDTLIDNPVFNNTGDGIRGANVSDNGTFGEVQAKDLVVNDLIFSGGANSTSAVGLQLGALNGASIFNPRITGALIGIKIDSGNSPGNPYQATNWSITNPHIFNNNTVNTSHSIHPGIYFNSIGGALNGTITGGKLYDTQATKTQCYPISFSGAFTWDNITIRNNQLLADTANGGTSITLQGSAVLGSNVSVYSNTDFSGTNPGQAAPDVTQLKEANGNLALTTTANATAVNYMTVAPSSTGGTTSITMNGADASPTLLFKGKGTGAFLFRPGSNNTNAFRFQNATGSAAAMRLDTTNMRVAIGDIVPTTRLDVDGTINVNSNPITNVATPTASTDAATKGYVDSVTDGGLYFNVKEFGAAGNGSTDDTAAIQAALTAANSAGGGVVYVPSGTYRVTDELIIYANTSLISETPHLSVFDASGMALTPKTGQGATARWWIVRTPNDTTPRANIRIQGIRFVGKMNTLYSGTNYTDPSKQQNGIGFRYADNFVVKDCEFYNIRTALLAGVPYNGGAWDAGMTNTNIVIEGNYAELCQGGLQVYSVNGVRWENNRFKTLADDCMAALGDCDNVIATKNQAKDAATNNGLGISASCNMFKIDSGSTTTASGRIGIYENHAYHIHRGVVVTQGADFLNCHDNRMIGCYYAAVQVSNSNEAKINDNHIDSCNSLQDSSIAPINVASVAKARILHNDVLGAGITDENGIRTVSVTDLAITRNETSVGGYGINVDTSTDVVFRDNTNLAVSNSTRGFITAAITGRGWFIDNVTTGTFSLGSAQIGNISSITDKRFRGNSDIRDEGNYQPRLILVRTISALATGNTLLFVVPTGKRLIVTSVCVRVGGATGTNTLVPSVSIGGNSTAYDDFLPNTAMTGVITTSKMFQYVPSFAVATYSQGTNLNFKVNTAATGNTTLTYDVDVFGELV